MQGSISKKTIGARSTKLCILEYMKTITCIDCEEQFSGHTPEEVQMAMLPHYKSNHTEIIGNANEEAKKVWFAEFNRRWEQA